MALARKQKRPVAVRYARRSSKKKGRRDTSLETESAECSGHADEQGYDLWPEVYVDPDTSAYRRADGTLKNRPGWLALADAIRTGQIDVVVCYDMNRLTRDVEVGIDFAKLCRRYGVDVEDTCGVRYRLTTPTGYSDFIAVCNAAQRNSAAKSEVVTRELGTAAREGSPAGGPPLISTADAPICIGGAAGHGPDRGIRHGRPEVVRSGPRLHTLTTVSPRHGRDRWCV